MTVFATTPDDQGEKEGSEEAGTTIKLACV
jgi:hypothetical protein